tara:strand:- start:3234 stop:4268 length:1035 start_codon:yes stop_codon:yes gene_type:complete
MEFYERDFFVSRLLAGYVKLDFKKLKLYVHPPTPEVNYESQEIFMEAYEEAFMSGVFTRQEMRNYMLQNGLWSKAEEKEKEKVKKEAEDLKIQLYKNFINPVKKKAIRSLIREAEQKLLNLAIKESTYNHTDCEGLATYARLNWLTQNTTKNLDGSLYSFNEIDVSSVLKRYQAELLDDLEAREIARTEPWRNNWNSSKYTNGLFNVSSPIQLNQEQKSVLAYSQMYDNISESHESPVDDIIQDDDALDGWLIKQRRESEKRKNQKGNEDRLGAHSGADEVYVVTEGKEEAEAVYDMNDGEAMYNVSERFATLERDGEIDYTAFGDVKRRLNEQMNDMMKSRRG